MAVGSHLDPGACQKAIEARGLSRPVLLLTLAVITLSSLSALSLYRLVVLSAEVDGLKSEVFRRREESQEAKRGEQVNRSNIFIGITRTYSRAVATSY